MKPTPSSPTLPTLPSLPSLPSLPQSQLLQNLYRIISLQQQKLFQFHTLLTSHIEKTKSIEKKYLTEVQYSKQVHEKLEDMRKQNYRLKVQIGLLRSDNIVLRSRLGYRDTGDLGQEIERVEGQGRAKQEKKKGQNQNSNNEKDKQKQIKSLMTKIANIRKVSRKLMKALQQTILNNEQQQSQILSQLTLLVQHLK